MIKSEQSGDRLVGTYRGIVLKHLPHGRCKIYIPSVHDPKFASDPDLLPSAQPKTPLFAGTNKGNGMFSYPNLSSIVWCTFMNGDVNFPVFDSATLGGENAFGQYDLIKKKDEPVSDRHLITSGKTHVMWYEKGILSGIVEDPIRTHCSVDFDQFELEANNTSVENKYSYSISNEICDKISKNELSNINCQYVLNNDGAAHGVLSTSTHWYDIVDINLSDQQYTCKGTVSTDNHDIMDNNGVIQIGTLSTCQLFETDKKKLLTNNTKEKVKTELEMRVPGTYDQVLKKKSDVDFKSPDKIETTASDSTTAMHRDISADVDLYSTKEVKQNLQDIKNKRTVNLTSDLENRFQMQDLGKLVLSSELHETALSADKKASTTFSKKEDLSADLALTTKATVQLQNLSSIDLIDIKPGSSVISKAELTNLYEMGNSGTVQIETKKAEVTSRNAGVQETIRDKSFSKTDMDVTGKNVSKAQHTTFHSINGSTIEVDNISEIGMENKTDAKMAYKSSGKKKIDGSPVIDTQYTNVINTTTSTANIQIVDNITKKECVNNMNAKLGMTEIRITHKESGMHCTIKMDAQGKMTIDTTDSLAITTTNTVSVQTTDASLQAQTVKVNASETTVISPTTKIIGSTTVDGTLHVTGATTIDADAQIGGKSFLGHMHIGNMGAPTSPPV